MRRGGGGEEEEEEVLNCGVYHGEKVPPFTKELPKIQANAVSSLS